MIQSESPPVATVIAVTRTRVGGEAFGAAAWQTPERGGGGGPRRPGTRGVLTGIRARAGSQQHSAVVDAFRIAAATVIPPGRGPRAAAWVEHFM